MLSELLQKLVEALLRVEGLGEGKRVGKHLIGRLLLEWRGANGLRYEYLAFLIRLVHVVARCQSRRRRSQNLG